MELMDVLNRRKSVRSYTGEPASDEELACVLKAGKAAPVAMARYNDVQLSVITNPELLAKINAAGAEMFGDPNRSVLYGAPMLILASAKLSGADDNPMLSSAAMAVHNMALAATDLGLGSCDIWGAIRGVLAKPELVAELGLPEGFVPCCALALGKTDESFPAREVPKGEMLVSTIA